MANFKELLTKVKAFVFDVDGVYSEARVLLSASGELLRTMSTKDGFATKIAVDKGYPVAIISGGKSESVRTRFQGLGVTDIYLASTDKMEDFKDFYFKYGLELENILYMGDDLPDYEIMTHVGIPVCPADAVPEIKKVAKYISDKNGGNGCVRDVIEQVLRAQGNWEFDKNSAYKQ